MFDKLEDLLIRYEEVMGELQEPGVANDPERFRELYNALLVDGGYNRPDPYFILKDFRSYAEAQKRVEAAYRDEKGWARIAMLNVAHAGKFTSDRTIQEYVDDIWKLDKVTVELPEEAK